MKNQAGLSLPGGDAEASCGCPVNPGHNATASLGGADWQSLCGAFRVPIATQWPAEFDTKTGCGDPDKPGACSAQAPRGMVMTPFDFTVPAAGNVVTKLTLPTEGRLLAVEFTRVTVGGIDAIDDLSVDQFRSGQNRQAFPGYGDSTVGWSDPETTPIPAREFTAKAILDGQNRLPTWIANVNPQNSNDFVGMRLNNANVAAVRVQGFLWVAYSQG